jgi:putative peptidoglycan lipid II flippase
MGIKVLAPGFYARQDMKTPVRIAVIAVLTDMVVALSLMVPLGHVGLALATTAAASVNASLLLLGLLRGGSYRPQPGWTWLLVRGLGACLIMGLILWWAAGDTTDWLDMGIWTRVPRLLGVMIAGAAAYVLALLAFGIRLGHFRPSSGRSAAS